MQRVISLRRLLSNDRTDLVGKRRPKTPVYPLGGTCIEPVIIHGKRVTRQPDREVEVDRNAALAHRPNARLFPQLRRTRSVAFPPSAYLARLTLLFWSLPAYPSNGLTCVRSWHAKNNRPTYCERARGTGRRNGPCNTGASSRARFICRHVCRKREYVYRRRASSFRAPGITACDRTAREPWLFQRLKQSRALYSDCMEKLSSLQ